MEDLKKLSFIVCVDIDGTIADSTHRLHFIHGSDEPDWDGFHSACGEDKPIQEMIDLVKVLDKKYMIVFCTGRSDIAREQTEIWLKQYLGEIAIKAPLLMRKKNDRKQDWDIKPKMVIDAGYELTNIAFVLEDRQRVVDKWRELGVRCLQCDEGDF